MVDIETPAAIAAPAAAGDGVGLIATLQHESQLPRPFTDFGFKRLFGQEASKPLLRDFLNALLPPAAQIRELTFKNSEQPGTGLAGRKAIFNIYC